MGADLTQDIDYRGFLLNNAAIRDSIAPGVGATKGRITGSVVDSWDLTDVDITQYTEKRALQDGLDVGDVFQGGRRLKVAGTLYGGTRKAFYDILDEFMAITNPVLAQRVEPRDKGYLPLQFAKPTDRTDEYPSGIIELEILALPRGRQYIIQRDQQGGEDGDALAVPWQATFFMRDPAVYARDPFEVSLEAGGTIAGNFVNRGNYITGLNLLVEVGSAAGSISISAGGSNMIITVPASTGDRIIRYHGTGADAKTLFFEENSVETLRMDLLNTGVLQQHPIVPPGTSAYTVTFTSVTPQSGSLMWFTEAYA